MVVDHETPGCLAETHPSLRVMLVEESKLFKKLIQCLNKRVAILTNRKETLNSKIERDNKNGKKPLN
jgi:hypothetical protein